MLLGIHVKNLALIDEVEVDFGEHLNILTGETGAGKSVLIGSVNLALGGKATKDLIRKGADAAYAELFFSTKDQTILNKLADLDISAEDGNIVIARKILPNRSVCRVNGEVVSVKTLAELSTALIDIHGQHDHQSLMYKQKHLEILDDFSKDALGSLKMEMAEAYKKYKAFEKQALEAQKDEEQRKRELAFLQYEIQEIEAARLMPGEDEQLSALYKKMIHSKKITEGANEAHQLTGDVAADAISRALRCLYPAADFDEQLSGMIAQLEDVENILNDFNREISNYMDDLVFDQEAFDEVEERLDLINNLKAKYGQSIELIIEYKEKQEEKCQQLENYEQYMEELIAQKEIHLKEYKDIAKKVSDIRKKKSKVLVKEIKEALLELNFLDVCFEMEIEETKEFTANGCDQAEFLISTNPGEDVKPLGHVASGGELSRIMLAIKSVLADADAIETLIFDEIDTGISGRTAQKVSERLAVIANKHQVLCISHLPQIASMADDHYLIEKHVEDGHTQTQIHHLDDDLAAVEIARMLGGVEITDTVLENAREMKKLAAQSKKY